MDAIHSIPHLKEVARRSARRVANRVLGRHCAACGRQTRTKFRPIYTPELAAGHGFDARWTRAYDRREGVYCPACGTNARSLQIARVLIDLYDPACPDLDSLCDRPGFRALAIAEVNECRALHQFLVRVPGLRYSEFGSTDPAVPHEDVMALSYPDGAFDLVLTSETLEHVPDPGRALREVRRVLRPGGRHVFTVPVLWDRPRTLTRATIEDGRIVHLLPPCYHGGSLNPLDCLAFSEFGADVLDLTRAAGFRVDVVEDRRNPALKVIVAERVEE